MSASDSYIKVSRLLEENTYDLRLALLAGREGLGRHITSSRIQKPGLALTGLVGEVGGKLHTARSRNDQIALDIRLYLREEIGRVSGLVASLKAGFLGLAKKGSARIPPLWDGKASERIWSIHVPERVPTAGSPL